MRVEDIRKIVEIACSSNLLELEVEDEGFKVRIKRSPHPIELPAQEEAEETGPEIHYIKAPLVGTFRLARSPEESPLISVGSDVDEGQVVCYIEAMKIPNEVISDRKGKVIEILVKDGDPVQYGQHLIALEIWPER